MIRQLTLLAVLLVFCSAAPSSNCGLFCNICQQGLGLVQKNLDAIEAVTNDKLVGFIDHVCGLFSNVEVAKLLCDVAKNDVVDGVNKVLEFLKQSTDPEATCHQLYIC